MRARTLTTAAIATLAIAAPAGAATPTPSPGCSHLQPCHTGTVILRPGENAYVGQLDSMAAHVLDGPRAGRTLRTLEDLPPCPPLCSVYGKRIAVRYLPRHGRIVNTSTATLRIDIATEMQILLPAS